MWQDILFHSKHSFQALLPSIPRTMAVNIPIVIVNLIDGDAAEPAFYHAFSPFQFFPEGNHELQKQALVERVILWVLEKRWQHQGVMYVDSSQTPLAGRWAQCFFSTYNHLIEGERVIYPGSVMFDGIVAGDYMAVQPNLTHKSCHHEFM